ncbi:MAG: hypothetical protein LBL34_02965, partial [Clostridiales bacterium]|nr:hypothetical protein [Clostridiales bacterium]
GGGGASGDITITGGTVTATGNWEGAGIGSGAGSPDSDGTITISGGAVTANGDRTAAGIGGGGGTNGNIVIITGGTVRAISGNSAGAGIGGSDMYSYTGTTTIDGGSVYVSNFKGPQPKNSNSDNVYFNTLTVSDPGIEFLKFSGGTYGANTFVDNTELTTGQYGIHDVLTDEDGVLYLWLPSSGSEIVSLTAFDNTYSATYTRAANNNNTATLAGAYIHSIIATGENANNTAYINWNGDTLEILQDGTYTLSLREGVLCTFKDIIKISAYVTANITLDGVKIEGAGNAGLIIDEGATANLTLLGENSLTSYNGNPGLQVIENSTLTIGGTGSLEAVSGNGGGAGIGSKYHELLGTIIINSGTITAIGSTTGAGIGGGNSDLVDEIIINGGTVNAIGGDFGAGIGGGYGEWVGKITINGGTVTAQGGAGGAGIGSGTGYSDIAGEIEITGGEVTATGGTSGAGIGGGASSEGGTIAISGGTITATGDSASDSSAIGGGYTYPATGTVTIDGGSVKVNNFLGPQPKNSGLDNVYLNTLTLDDPSAANARVTKLTTAEVVGSASAGPASSIMAGEYGTDGVYTDESGILYAWLPDSATAEEELTVKAGGKTYTSAYIRAADNNNASTLAKIAGVEDVKVLLTPDSTSKNAGYDGHIDVSFDDATSYDAYALAIPMLFDKNTIEITNLETVDFVAKGLTGLLVNGTFLSGARDYDSSSEVLSVINSEGKFLLSWTVEEDIPLVPHTLTDDVYFTIHYRVKENVPTSASFAIGEYNDTNGITGDQIFGIDGRGILSSNQDDFGAYLLVEGEYGILTQDYISVTVEDMPPVTISGDVNSISLRGRAMLTGKQRTPISAIGYTPNLSKIDAGIRVEMYEVDDVGDIVKQVGSVAYTQEMNMTAAIGDPTSTLYNYTLNIPRTVANDLKISDPTGSSPKYMLRFSRFGDNGGSVVGTVREESYLWADIYLDGTAVNTGTIDESTPLTVGDTAYLYAGAFYLADADKFALTASDLNTIKGQVGNADITGVTTIYNINEYLGVDAADYTTVLRYVGQKKLQTLPLAVTN